MVNIESVIAADSEHGLMYPGTTSRHL